MNAFPDKVSWNGWTATLDSLKASGWVITEHRDYQKGLQWGKVKYFYLRHEPTRMLARLSCCLETEVERNIWEVDFLTHERNNRLRPSPVYGHEDISENDIETLLAIILQLQEDRKNNYPLKKIPASKNEIVSALLKTA